MRIITRFIKQIIGREKSNYKPTFEMLKLMFKWTDDFEKNRQTHESRFSYSVLVWYADVIEPIEYDSDGVAAFVDKYIDVIFTPQGDVILVKKVRLNFGMEG